MFIDNETGKEYKTEAALKGAITKRLNIQPEVTPTEINKRILCEFLSNCKHDGVRYEAGIQYELKEETAEYLRNNNLIK